MRLLHPCPGAYITQRFSVEHPGLDLAARRGTPILAAHDGLVKVAGWDDQGYGNRIDLVGSDVMTRYGHLQGFACRVGEQVRAGQVIGFVGNTGNVVAIHGDGSHLHWEVMPLPRNWNDGYLGRVDPEPLLAEGAVEMGKQGFGPYVASYQTGAESGPSVDVIVNSDMPYVGQIFEGGVFDGPLWTGPRAKRVFARFWIETPQLKGDAYEHTFMQRGAQGADEYVALLRPRYDAAQARGILDILSPNEPHPTDAEWPAYIAFTERWIALLAGMGLRPWVWSFSSGTPRIETVPLWAHTVTQARAAGGGLSIHHYNAPHLLNDPYHEWPQYGDQWLSCRFELVIDALYAAGVPRGDDWYLISEYGIDGLGIDWERDAKFVGKRRRYGWRDWGDWGITWDTYRAELEQAALRIEARPEIIAVLMFITHPRAAWQTYNHDVEQLRWMAGRWQGYKAQPVQPPVVAPDPDDALEELLASIAAEGQRVVIPYNPATAFAAAGRRRGFVPGSDEFRAVRDGVTYVAQMWRDPREAGLQPAFPRQFWSVCREGDWGNVMWWERMN